MEITKIVRGIETTRETFTTITFKNWFGDYETKLCITSKWDNSTIVASSGKYVPTRLWDTVEAFLRTKEDHQDM